MFKASGKSPSHFIPCSFVLPAWMLAMSGLALALPGAGCAQTAAALVAARDPAEGDSGLLPDAPQLGGGQSAPSSHARGKSPLDKQVDPKVTPPKLTVGDKILLGMRESVSPFAVTGWVATASVQQARGSRPNYPGTVGGYGQRLGAAAARSSSDSIITDSVLASILREDPRYYKLGVGHGVWERTEYAIGRVFVTRTDGGKRTPNLSLLIGDVAGASLTQLYYPRMNRGVGDVAETYGTSLLGAGIGFYVREFSGKWLYVLHLRPDYD